MEPSALAAAIWIPIFVLQRVTQLLQLTHVKLSMSGCAQSLQLAWPTIQASVFLCCVLSSAFDFAALVAA